MRTRRQFILIPLLCALLDTSAVAAQSVATGSNHPELLGFEILPLDSFPFSTQGNPTDALWSALSRPEMDRLATVIIRATRKDDYATVDLTLDGVSDPGYRAYSYRAVTQRTEGGWRVSHVGRRHRCAGQALGLLTSWTTEPCS